VHFLSLVFCLLSIWLRSSFDVCCLFGCFLLFVCVFVSLFVCFWAPLPFGRISLLFGLSLPYASVHWLATSASTTAAAPSLKQHGQQHCVATGCAADRIPPCFFIFFEANYVVFTRAFSGMSKT